MNTKKTIAALTALVLTTAVAGAQEAPDPNAHGDPYVPVGNLGVNPTFVQTGVKPNLDWNIEYPELVKDLAIVGGGGSVITTKGVDIEVRLSGVCFDCGTENGQQLPVAVWVRTGGEGSYWTLIFYGNAYDVDPSKVLFKKWIETGTAFDVAARGRTASGSWYPIVWSIDEQGTMASLVNGESVPDSVITEYASGDVESYTTALLSDDFMTVEVGPKDLIYFMDLSSTDAGEPCFDLEDVIVNVHFKGSNNNGHGNNIDGVDVSNPGQGGGGPNGSVDPSGEIDDEIKTYQETTTTTTSG